MGREREREGERESGEECGQKKGKGGQKVEKRRENSISLL